MSPDDLLAELSADPVLERFALEAEIEDAFAAVTAVDEDAITAPMFLAPHCVRVGTDLTWTLDDGGRS